jgi:hypothetical protein
MRVLNKLILLQFFLWFFPVQPIKLCIPAMAMSIAMGVPVSAPAWFTIVSLAVRGDLSCLPVTTTFPRSHIIGTIPRGSPVIEFGIVL